MHLRQIAALIALPIVTFLLFASWRAALAANDRRLDRNKPPQVLVNAHAQLTNRLAKVQIQASGTMVRQKWGTAEILAEIFNSFQSPKSLGFGAPRKYVDWKRLKAETQIQLQNCRNEEEMLYLEYRMTTHNSLPQGFPR